MHGPNYNEPPPNLIDGEEEYEVEAILGSRHHGRGRKLQYLVKWKGYSEAENQWVDAKDIHMDQLLQQFRQTLSRRINTQPVHCRRVTSTPMSDHASPTSTELQVISFEAVPGEGPERQEALAAREAFMSWRPTCASSWRTPSESSSSSEEHHSDDGLPSGAVSPSPSYLFPHKKDISPSMLAEHLDNLSSLLSPGTTKSTTPNLVSHSTVPSLTPPPPPTNQTVYTPSKRGSPCECPDRFIPPTPPLSPSLPLITAFKSETPLTPWVRASSEGTSGMFLKTLPSPAKTLCSCDASVPRARSKSAHRCPAS